MNAPAERITVPLNGGAELSVPIHTLVDTFLRAESRASGYTSPPQPTPSEARIGDVWPGHGGRWAGIARGRDGDPNYHLIVADRFTQGVTWQQATEWAQQITADDRNDFTLPTRAESALLLANVPELFEKEWYWTSEPYAAIDDYAWSQSFGTGFQNLLTRSAQLRARAVRRLDIQ